VPDCDSVPDLLTLMVPVAESLEHPCPLTMMRRFCDLE